MIKNTYNTKSIDTPQANTSAVDYMFKCNDLDSKELRTILQSVIIDCETPQLQKLPMQQYRGFLFGRIDKYNKSGARIESDDMDFKDSNSPVAKFAKELLKNTFIRKYKIIELFTFYDKKEIWAISQKVDLMLNIAFDEETFKLSKELRIDVIPMLIEKNELNYSEIPEHDDEFTNLQEIITVSR